MENRKMFELNKKQGRKKDVLACIAGDDRK